jgi:DNA-binding transcriptional regulator YdaS (Cro superfamily)
MKALIEIRNNRFKNQQQMAEAIGVSQATLSSWLSGVQKVSPNNVKKIESLFGISRKEIRPDIYD